MKVDDLGCLIMEKDGEPGDLGDSCAETGRFCVIAPPGIPFTYVDLSRFVTEEGFVRHPRAPWREDDFTSDQMIYLLMGSFLRDRDVYEYVRSHLDRMQKARLPDVWLLKWQAFHLLGVTAIAQIILNAFPIRWSDAHDREGFWNVWRFTWSSNSTVSFMTVTTTMIFLKRVGITWPLFFFNRDRYLERTAAYYADQPDSSWFVELFRRALA